MVVLDLVYSALICVVRFISVTMLNQWNCLVLDFRVTMLLLLLLFCWTLRVYITCVYVAAVCCHPHGFPLWIRGVAINISSSTVACMCIHRLPKDITKRFHGFPISTSFNYPFN